MEEECPWVPEPDPRLEQLRIRLQQLQPQPKTKRTRGSSGDRRGRPTSSASMKKKSLSPAAPRPTSTSVAGGDPPTTDVSGDGDKSTRNDEQSNNDSDSPEVTPAERAKAQAAEREQRQLLRQQRRERERIRLGHHDDFTPAHGSGRRRTRSNSSQASKLSTQSANGSSPIATDTSCKHRTRTNDTYPVRPSSAGPGWTTTKSKNARHDASSSRKKSDKTQAAKKSKSLSPPRTPRATCARTRTLVIAPNDGDDAIANESDFSSAVAQNPPSRKNFSDRTEIPKSSRSQRKNVPDGDDEQDHTNEASSSSDESSSPLLRATPTPNSAGASGKTSSLTSARRLFDESPSKSSTTSTLTTATSKTSTAARWSRTPQRSKHGGKGDEDGEKGGHDGGKAGEDGGKVSSSHSVDDDHLDDVKHIKEKSMNKKQPRKRKAATATGVGTDKSKCNTPPMSLEVQLTGRDPRDDGGAEHATEDKSAPSDSSQQELAAKLLKRSSSVAVPEQKLAEGISLTAAPERTSMSSGDTDERKVCEADNVAAPPLTATVPRVTSKTSAERGTEVDESLPSTISKRDKSAKLVVETSQKVHDNAKVPAPTIADDSTVDKPDTATTETTASSASQQSETDNQMSSASATSARKSSRSSTPASPPPDSTDSMPHQEIGTNAPASQPGPPRKPIKKRGGGTSKSSAARDPSRLIIRISRKEPLPGHASKTEPCRKFRVSEALRFCHLAKSSDAARQLVAQRGAQDFIVTVLTSEKAKRDRSTRKRQRERSWRLRLAAQAALAGAGVTSTQPSEKETQPVSADDATGPSKKRRRRAVGTPATPDPLVHSDTYPTTSLDTPHDFPPSLARSASGPSSAMSQRRSGTPASQHESDTGGRQRSLKRGGTPTPFGAGDGQRTMALQCERSRSPDDVVFVTGDALKAQKHDTDPTLPNVHRQDSVNSTTSSVAYELDRAARGDTLPPQPRRMHIPSHTDDNVTSSADHNPSPTSTVEGEHDTSGHMFPPSVHTGVTGDDGGGYASSLMPPPTHRRKKRSHRDRHHRDRDHRKREKKRARALSWSPMKLKKRRRSQQSYIMPEPTFLQDPQYVGSTSGHDLSSQVPPEQQQPSTSSVSDPVSMYQSRYRAAPSQHQPGPHPSFQPMRPPHPNNQSSLSASDNNGSGDHFVAPRVVLPMRHAAGARAPSGASNYYHNQHSQPLEDSPTSLSMQAHLAAAQIRSPSVAMQAHRNGRLFQQYMSPMQRHDDYHDDDAEINDEVYGRRGRSGPHSNSHSSSSGRNNHSYSKSKSKSKSKDRHSASGSHRKQRGSPSPGLHSHLQHAPPPHVHYDPHGEVRIATSAPNTGRQDFFDAGHSSSSRSSHSHVSPGHVCAPEEAGGARSRSSSIVRSVGSVSKSKKPKRSKKSTAKDGTSQDLPEEEEQPAVTSMIVRFG